MQSKDIKPQDVGALLSELGQESQNEIEKATKGMEVTIDPRSPLTRNSTSGWTEINIFSNWLWYQVHWFLVQQDIPGNRSQIRVEFRVRSGSGAISMGAANRTGGVTAPFSATVPNFGFTHGAAATTTTVFSSTGWVNHAGDGTLTFNVSAWMALNGSLGSWGNPGSRTVSMTGQRVPNIARVSTVSGNPNWTAGSNFTININRQSTAFRHTVQLQMQNASGVWQTIKTFNNVAGSVSSGFSVAENRTIFTHLAQGASRSTRINLTTLTGTNGSSIGSNTSGTGSVTAPARTVGRITNPAGVSVTAGQEHSTVWIDQADIRIDLPRVNSAFHHTLRFKDGNSGNVVAELTNQGASATWVPTQAQRNQLYARTPNGIEFDGQVDILTFYDGVQVRNQHDLDINFRVRNSNPTFPVERFTYSDIDATVTAVTDNNQIIVQNRSNVRVNINAAATAVNSATISHYEVTLGGRTVNGTSTGNYDLGQVNITGNSTLSVRVVDSRGFSVTTTRSVTGVAYHNPSITATARRNNGFDVASVITLRGSFASIGNNNLNLHRYSLNNGSSWTNFTLSTNTSGTFIANSVNLNIPVENTQSVRIEVRDRFNVTTTWNATIDRAQPIVFMDSTKNSVGINCFPNGNNILDVNGNIRSTGASRDFFFTTPSRGGTWLRLRQGDNNGSGVCIGDGGLTIIGGGEAHTATLNAYANPANEVLELVSDGDVFIRTGMQDGFNVANSTRFRGNGDVDVSGGLTLDTKNTNGSLTIDGGTTAGAAGGGVGNETHLNMLAGNSKFRIWSRDTNGGQFGIWDDPSQRTFLGYRADINTVTIGGPLSVQGDVTLDTALANIRYSSPSSPNRIWCRLREQDVNGSGVIIGAGGVTVVGGGESANALWETGAHHGAGTEQLWLTSDNTVRFFTNCNTIENRRESWIDTNNDFHGLRAIHASGQVNAGNIRMNGANTIENRSSRIWVAGVGGVSLRSRINTGDGSAENASFDIGNDGNERVWSMSIWNRSGVTTGGTSLHVNSSGTLFPTSSARKYKVDIQDAGDLEFAKRILNLKPRSWYDKGALEQISRIETLKSEHCQKTIRAIEDGCPTGELEIPYFERSYGLVAEEVAEVGLDKFCTWHKAKEDGSREIQGIQYDRLWTLLIPLVREQDKRIVDLEARLEKLEEAI